jgi:hypothetical protein
MLLLSYKPNGQYLICRPFINLTARTNQENLNPSYQGQNYAESEAEEAR